MVYMKHALCSFPITHAGFPLAPVPTTQTPNYLKTAKGREGVEGR